MHPNGDAPLGTGPFLSRFWRGDLPLWKGFAFTLGWGLVLVFVGYLLFVNQPLPWIVFAVFTALVGFCIACSVAIWRSADKAERRWKRLTAKTAVVIGGLGVAAAMGSIVWFAYATFDLSTTSRTIEAKIEYDPTLPLIGFWKIDCANDFGFALEKASATEYSVRFCGPGGCMSGNLWRTTVVDDPIFKTFEDGTLGLRGDDQMLERAQRQGAKLREGFLPLHRCSAPAGKSPAPAHPR